MEPYALASARGEQPPKPRATVKKTVRPRDDGLYDAEYRSNRPGRDPIHRAVRAELVHRRSRGLPHRPVSDPIRHDDGPRAGRQARFAVGFAVPNDWGLSMPTNRSLTL